MEPSVTELVIKDFGELQGIMPKFQQVLSLKRTLNNQDTLLMAPTGFGKSLIYQAIPYCRMKLDCIHMTTGGSPVLSDYCVIVISPLDALIRDSITSIKDIKPQHQAVHLKPGIISDILSSASCSYNFIFTTPETICSTAGKQLVRKLRQKKQLKAIFIDECHCITSWGLAVGDEHAFRISYSMIGELRSLAAVPFVAVTATATPKSVEAIKESLCLRLDDYGLIKISANKTNITYHVHHITEALPFSLEWLADYINEPETRRALVFFPSVPNLSAVYSMLIGKVTKKGALEMYHQSTPENSKATILADMARDDGEIKVVLCTTSLSMGLNLANVGLALCVGSVESCEMFMQQTGRVARDGSKGEGVVLTVKGSKKNRTNMAGFLAGTICRRKALLTELGETVNTDLNPCCDVCQPDIRSSVWKYIAHMMTPGQPSIQEGVQDESINEDTDCE